MAFGTGVSARLTDLPYYTIMVSASGGEYTHFNIRMFNNEEEGGFPGYSHDYLADLIRDTLNGLTGVSSIVLKRYDETSTTL